MICTGCGTHTADGKARGSGWIELALWLLFLWPIALVYTIWRRAGPSRSCPACGSATLVPDTSPAGRSLVARHYPSGVPTAAPQAPAVRPRFILIVVLAVVALPALLLWWAAP